MTESSQTPRPGRRRSLLIALVALIVVVAGGVGVWTTTCPCDQTPGFVLFGDMQRERVTDWQFANAVPLCQIQMYAGPMPHSVNLNCMATPDGRLYLSCGACDTKFWGRHVQDGESGRVRLNGKVYPVTFTRVTDPNELEQAWAARTKKLLAQGGGEGNPAPAADAKRPAAWGSFRLTSATD